MRIKLPFLDHPIDVADVHKAARKAYQYKELKKHNNYAPMKSYTSFTEIAECLALEFFSADNTPWDDIKEDFARRTILNVSWKALFEPYKVIALAPELYRAFQETDLPKNLGVMKRVIPEGFLLLPPGIKSPDGTDIRWLVFRHVLKGEKPPEMEFRTRVKILTQPFDYEGLSWATHLADGSCYASTFELTPEIAVPNARNVEIHPSIENVGKNIEQEAEADFLYSVSSILYQVLLYMQRRQDSLTEVSTSQIVTRGLGFSTGVKTLRRPQWVGLKYKLRKAVKSVPLGGTHARPRRHWRRGYFRDQAHGPGYLQHHSVWIEPVLINDDV